MTKCSQSMPGSSLIFSVDKVWHFREGKGHSLFLYIYQFLVAYSYFCGLTQHEHTNQIPSNRKCSEHSLPLITSPKMPRDGTIAEITGNKILARNTAIGYYLDIFIKEALNCLTAFNIHA